MRPLLISTLLAGALLLPQTWRRVHRVFAVIIVLTSVIRALLIEGTMDAVSK